MRHRVCLLLVVLVGVVLAAGSAAGFNGQRQGFVLGGGLGVAPVARHSYQSFSETNAAGAAHIVIGYGWDNRNMLVYEGNAAGYTENTPYGEYSVGQGFSGGAWYHYFKPRGQSLFTVAGIGFYAAWVEGVEDITPGFGGLLGGGYAFTRHFQVGGYFSFGQAKQYERTHGYNHFSVLVSGIAF